VLFDDTLASVTTHARRFREKAAIICGEKQLSFLELDDRVARMASAFRVRGIGTKDVVSLYGPVGWEWVVAYHAALRAGAVVNPINALLTPDEVGYIVGDCGARLMVADRGRLDALRAGTKLDAALDLLDIAEIDTLSSTGELQEPNLRGDPTALSTICYTSGTTGRPKGALLTHRNVLMNAGLTGLMHGRTAADITVSALPLAHVYGNVVMNGSLLAGATLVLLPAFSPEAVLEAIATHRATRFEGVPTMYYRLLDAPGLTDAAVETLTLCTVGGQTMPVDKMRAVETRFGCPLIELWGMSEIGGLGTTFPWTGQRTLGSIGIALPGMAVRTVDPDTRQPTAADKPGELQIRGPTVMIGYLGNPDATRETLDAEGWLSTGDVARIDADGQVFVIDRMKDVILTSGNNVYPAEIERAISSLAGVTMVGVGRDTHPDKGEVPHAYIVTESGVVISPDQVIEHCRSLLAPYKFPRHISFVEDLPKTSSGKILRRMLGKALNDSQP
jgi:long-chain acyl-CoA synthetase